MPAAPAAASRVATHYEWLAHHDLAVSDLRRSVYGCSFMSASPALHILRHDRSFATIERTSSRQAGAAAIRGGRAAGVARRRAKGGVLSRAAVPSRRATHLAAARRR